MDEYEAAVDVFEKRERTAFTTKLQQMEQDHKNRIASITTQHMYIDKFIYIFNFISVCFPYMYGCVLYFFAMFKKQ